MVVFKNQLYILIFILSVENSAVHFSPFHELILFVFNFCVRVPKVAVLVLIMFQMEHMLLEMLILLSEVMGHQMLDLHYLQRLIDVGMR